MARLSLRGRFGRKSPLAALRRVRWSYGLWMARYWLLAAMVVLIMFAWLGAHYQQQASSADRDANPLPGQLVATSTQQLHLHCIGDGSPTVIFESGLGGTWVDWTFAQPTIGQQTRACSYDRPGLGWSPPADQPIATINVAQNLHDALTHANIEPPYVLVGHSMGGVHVREFAAQFPDDMAGLVFVDSSHEEQGHRLIWGETGIESVLLVRYSICNWTARFGLMRLFKRHNNITQHTPYPAEQRNALLATLNQSHTCRAIRNEFLAAYDDVTQNGKPLSVGNLPVAVLTAGRELNFTQTELETGVTVDGVDNYRRRGVWFDLQREIAAISTNSIHLAAEQSGHYIHSEQPDMVIGAIEWVLAQHE